MSVSVPGNSCRPASCYNTVSTGCPIRVYGQCVFYSGVKLTGPGINTGDNFDTVTNKLNSYITSFGSGTVTSVGLTMPAAFSVSNTPVTTSGILAVTAIGNTSQYIRGDGTLATFPVFSSDNGLTLSGTNTQWGGTLIHDTAIVNAGFRLTFSNNNSFSTVYGSNSSTGAGIEGNNSGSGIGVLGTGSTGPGGAFSSSTSYGATIQSNSGIALLTSGSLGAQMSAFNTSVLNNNIPIITLVRSTGFVLPANGVAGSIDFRMYTDSGIDKPSHSLISRWTTVADATRTSQLEIWGVNSTVFQQQFTVKGTGQLRINNYGSGIFTGTPIYSLLVDASGNVIEGSISSSSFTFYKQMIVGSGVNNAPADGATTYTDASLINKSISVFLDGLELGTGLSDRVSYTFSISTGVITWNSGLGHDQLIRLYTY